jgi:hypothetical protein
MNVLQRGDGPEPENLSADVLAGYNKEQGGNSLTAWLLSFSLPNAWNHLCRTRCKLWDDRELDLFEGIKFWSWILGQLALTS